MKGRIVGEQTQKVPIIGNIRVGEKDEKGIPHSLDYFKATGKYASLFHQCFGPNPTKIEVCFFSDNIVDSCNERWELRKGPKLYAYGDGEFFYVWDGKKEYKEHKGDKDPLAKKIDSEWKRILTLTFAILKIRGVMGMWRFTTSAEASSMPQIITAFDTVLNTAGTVVNIPFDLIVDYVTSQKPDSKASFPVVKLIPNVSREHLELMHDALDAGKNIKGIATEEKIDEITQEPAQIAHEDFPPKNPPLPAKQEKKGTTGQKKSQKQPDTPKNESEGEPERATDAVIESFNGTEVPATKNPKGDVKKALVVMDTIDTMEKLRQTRKNLSSRSWTAKEKGILDKRLDEVAAGIEQMNEESPFK